MVEEKKLGSFPLKCLIQQQCFNSYHVLDQQFYSNGQNYQTSNHFSSSFSNFVAGTNQAQLHQNNALQPTHSKQWMDFQNSNPLMPYTLNTINGTHQSRTSQPNQFLNYQNSKPFTPFTVNTINGTHQSRTSLPNQFLNYQNSKLFIPSTYNTVNGTHQSTASQSNQLLNDQNSDALMPTPLNLTNTTTHQTTTINSENLESANQNSTGCHVSSSNQNCENLPMQVNNVLIFRKYQTIILLRILC